jgi:hypothetical protein
MKQRWAVDIYQDQYESLQQLALEERKQGGIGSMSAMVRQALDELRRHFVQITWTSSPSGLYLLGLPLVGFAIPLLKQRRPAAT